MATYPIYYKKAIRGNVSGKWINPRDQEDEFLLKGDPSNPKDDIELQRLEFRNKEATDFFKRFNKAALEKGYIIPEGEPMEDNQGSPNAISDLEIKTILTLTLAKLEKRLAEFTSPIPVQRILDAAKDTNKPWKIVDMISKKLEEMKT